MPSRRHRSDRHFGANPFHHDADLVFGGKLPAARLLGSADQLQRRSPRRPPGLPSGRPTPLSSLAYSSCASSCSCGFLFTFLFHDSPFFLRILSAGWVNPKAQNLQLTNPL